MSSAHRRESELQNGIVASAGLSYLGWLASGFGSDTSKGPNKVAPMMKGRRVKGGGQRGSSGSYGMTPLKRSDLLVKPMSMTNVPKSIPRNITSQIVWDVVKIDTSFMTSTSGLTEYNYSGSLSMHPQGTTWTQLFDQWSIPFMSYTMQSQIAPGSVNGPTTLYSALDFDNINALGSISTLEDFSSCEVMVMGQGAVNLRSVRPSCKLQTQFITGNGLSTVSGPVWCDSTTTTVVFNGIRHIFSATLSPQPILGTATLYFCFRNTI